jgi:putative DNA primase/helicase
MSRNGSLKKLKMMKRKEAEDDAALAAVPAVSGLLITPTASGKSTQARETIAKMLEDHPGKCIGITSPRHALNDEQAVDLRERLGDKYRVAVYRGRNAEDPDAPLESDEPGAKRLRMCVVHDKIGELVGAGGAAEDLCRKGTQKKPGCPHWQTCGYIRQREADADVWLFAHNVRTKKKPKPIGELAAVFVDESPVGVHMGGVDGSPVAVTFGELQDVIDALGRLRDGYPEDNTHKAEEADLERRAVERLREALMAGENGRVGAGGLPDLTGAGRLTWATCEKPTVAHAMSRSEFEAALALNGPYNATVRRVHRLFEIIKSAERDIVPGLTKTDTGVTMSWKVGVGDGFDVPTLYMDATARPEVYQALFPAISDDRITRVDVAAPHMAVTQVTNWNASRRKLVPSGAAVTAKSAANNVERLRDLIEVEAYRKRDQGGLVGERRVDVLVVTYKATAAALEAGRLPSNVDVTYLGNLTGLDRWRGVAGLILAGWGFIGVGDVERRAELLKGAPLEALAHARGDWYAEEIVGGRRRGSDFGPGLTRCFHTDPMAEALRWSMVEGELIQAIGRGRGIRRSADDPLDVTILCNVPLPFEADFTTWAEVQPQPFELMAARGVELEAKPGARGFWTVVGAVLRTDGRKLGKAATQAAADGSRSRLYVPPANDNRDPWSAPDAFWLRGHVKLGRYSVPIRFDLFGDLADTFDDKACLVVSADQFPARRSASDILLRG